MNFTEALVDLVGPGAAGAAEGRYFIDLNGNSDAGPGAIHQDIATVSGHRYAVTFQLAGNPNDDPAAKTLVVKVGDRSQTFSFNVADHTNDSLGWTGQKIMVAHPDRGTDPGSPARDGRRTGRAS